MIAFIPKSTSTDLSKAIRAGLAAQARQTGYDTEWRGPQAEADYPQQATLVH